MPKYRKKPVVIEAFQYDKTAMLEGKTVFIPGWFIDATVAGTVFSKGEDDYIKTLEGDHKISNGDFVIQGVKGELYPCKPDIFEMTYELAA